MKTLVAILLFNAAWFACVLTTNWIGCVVVLAIAAMHWREWRLLASATLVGSLTDLLGARLGYVTYHGTPLLWIPAQWLNFAAILRGPLAWMHRRPWLAALGGATLGPLTYKAAEAWGAVRVHNVWAVATQYAIAMPLLMLLARREAARC